MNDITGIKQKENDQLIKEKINKAIFSNALKDSDLTMKLTQFLNDNNLNYDSSLKANNHNIKNLDNDSLVELRKKNPKAFDKIFLLDQPNDITLPSNGSKQLSKKQKGAAISI